MKIRTIPFKNVFIEMYRFGKMVFFYPSFNGNAEFKTYKECASYIRTCLYHERQFKETFGVGIISNIFNYLP